MECKKNKDSKLETTGVCKICKKKVEGKRKQCGYCDVKIRRARIKLAGIQLLGGQCSMCGYKENVWVLEFHHKNDDKAFDVSRRQNISWHKVKEEMLKCELLCANCHRGIHSKRKNDIFLDAVFDYAGDLDLGNVGGRIKKNKQSKDTKSMPKKDRPSVEELKEMLWTIPSTQIAKKYYVSGKAVEKWCKKHNLIKPPRGYWAKKKSTSL
jgi:hypothetical protein